MRATTLTTIILNALLIALSVRTVFVLALCAVGLALMITFEYRRVRKCRKTTQPGR